MHPQHLPADYHLISTSAKMMLLRQYHVLTPQIAGHNLKNKLGLIKFGNYVKIKQKIYT